VDMTRLVSASVLGVTIALLAHSVRAADQAIIDQVVGVAKIGCLLGGEYTFDAKANGDITFRKILPGAEAGLHTNLKEDPGAPGIIDQQLKVIASQQIRDCMKPYIDKLVELILGQVSGPSTITSAEAKSALDLGDCPDVGAEVFVTDDNKLETFLCSCPAHFGKPDVKGSNPYGSGSFICASALHAGAIKYGTASQILLRWVPSPPVFKGSTRNGVVGGASSQPDPRGAFVVAPAH
jgi:LCCL domain